MTRTPSIPIDAMKVEPRMQATIYPRPFALRVSGRTKRRLGDQFQLGKFGVNLTTLAPDSQSALLHRHSRQEEFVYVLSGTVTLRTGEEEHELGPGMCVGFRPDGPAHHLVNRSREPVHYLEIGDRPADDSAEYPEDDLVAEMRNGAWVMKHRDGTPWDDD